MVLSFDRGNHVSKECFIHDTCNETYTYILVYTKVIQFPWIFYTEIFPGKHCLLKRWTCIILNFLFSLSSRKHVHISFRDRGGLVQWPQRKADLQLHAPDRLPYLYVQCRAIVRFRMLHKQWQKISSEVQKGFSLKS